MGLTASDKGGASYPPMPAGLKLAICYGLYDLGHHYDEKYDKTNQECTILWEVPSERIEIDDKETGAKKNLPRAISQTYNVTLGEKANLRKMLESWRGKGFTAEELKAFDIKNILGQPCQLQIVHKLSKDGTKTYANIASIVQAQNQPEVVTAENNLQYFSFEDKMEIPEYTPKWIREKIERSDEYRHLNNAANIHPPINEPPPPSDVSGIITDEMPPPVDEDPLPF